MMHVPPTNWPVQSAGVVSTQIMVALQHAPVQGLGAHVVALASSMVPEGQVGPVTVHWLLAVAQHTLMTGQDTSAQSTPSPR